ncbi:DUF2155 domain-containing protein, partial [Ameyamaea chiangmaiensis]
MTVVARAGVPLLAVAFVCAVQGARGATAVSPPTIYPSNVWQGHAQAVVRVLDRLDSHVEVLTIPAGGNTQFKSLTLAVKACLDRPATLSPDAAVSLDIVDSHPEGARFSGWMLAAEPALNVLESPVYDVRVVGCAGDAVTPTPMSLQQLATATHAAAPVVEAPPPAAGTQGVGITGAAVVPTATGQG